MKGSSNVTQHATDSYYIAAANEPWQTGNNQPTNLNMYSTGAKLTAS